MKTLNSSLLLLVLIALMVYAIGFSGCSNSITNSGTPPKTYHGHSEQEFVANVNLKAEPGAVIVVNLEDLNSPPNSIPDMGNIGEDVFPYTYTETAEHKISIGDSSYFKMKLVNDSSGAVIYELTPSSSSITVIIPAGKYKLYITSLEEFASDSTGSQVVFIQPEFAPLSLTNTDYDTQQLNTLVRTKKCEQCDLSNANLSQMNLKKSILNRSNLTNANLNKADLSQADIRDAKLDNANLSYANLTYADLTFSKVRFANFTGANLTWTSIQHADLTKSNFAGAILYRTDLRSSNIREANFCGSIKTNIFAIPISTHNTLCWP